jgi:hypothetical protein
MLKRSTAATRGDEYHQGAVRASHLDFILFYLVFFFSVPTDEFFSFCGDDVARGNSIRPDMPVMKNWSVILED